MHVGFANFELHGAPPTFAFLRHAGCGINCGDSALLAECQAD
jgi:hypothetical protein